MRRLLRWLLLCGLVGLFFLGFGYWGTRTETPSLPDGVRREVVHLTLVGRSVSVALYHPAREDTAPLVVVAHGFTRSKRYMAGWGAHLAGEGFLVAVPTQPSLANHKLNGSVLAELVDRLRGKRRVGLVGFSMGGLTTLFAAAETPVDAWLGLDPVDMNGGGRKVAGRLLIPCAVLAAEPDAWNMNGNASGIVDALHRETYFCKIDGAKHLDAEWPTDLLGQWTCGHTTVAFQSEFRRLATAFLRSSLLDEREADQILRSACRREGKAPDQ